MFNEISPGFAIALTKPELVAALRKWEIDSRLGICLSREESVALSADDNAERSADILWSHLTSARPITVLKL